MELTLLLLLLMMLFVVTNFVGMMNNVSPVFPIPDHLQYFVCRHIRPVCNVVDPGRGGLPLAASIAWDTSCDDVLFYVVLRFPHQVSKILQFSLYQHTR